MSEKEVPESVPTAVGPEGMRTPPLVSPEPVCPNCGRCPTCGHVPSVPYMPVPRPWYGPVWVTNGAYTHYLS